MLSILICHSYFLRFDSKQYARAKPYPPLATLQVAALLRRAGHRVALFDAMLSEGTHEFDRQLGAAQPQLVLMYEDNFNYLSKMCLGKMRAAGCEMIASARRAGARVLAAGSDVSDAPEVYLRAGADAIVLGEGHEALRALLARLQADPQASGLPLITGLAGAGVLDQGQPVIHPQSGTAAHGHGHPAAPAPRSGDGAPVVEWHHARQPPAAQRDPAGDAAWDLVDIARYRSVWQQARGHFSLNMAASKGCSFRCSWCAKPIWGDRYQQRSPESVAAEMLQLRNDFQPDHIWFADDIFGFRVDWVLAFAAAMQAGGGGVPFTIQTRADLISPAMAQALQAAGCREAWIGAESGSQAVLDAMNKGTTVAEILAARARLKAAGIRVGFFIQLGYLGEQLDDLLATRTLIDEARPDEIGVSVSYPLPGTKFHEQVRAQLGDKTHWDESNDLAMMFEGTYTSGFYRAVRDLLHAQVDAEALNAPATAGEHLVARAELQQRWAALVAGERAYRSQSHDAAAA